MALADQRRERLALREAAGGKSKTPLRVVVGEANDAGGVEQQHGVVDRAKDVDETAAFVLPLHAVGAHAMRELVELARKRAQLVAAANQQAAAIAAGGQPLDLGGNRGDRSQQQRARQQRAQQAHHEHHGRDEEHVGHRVADFGRDERGREADLDERERPLVDFDRSADLVDVLAPQRTDSRERRPSRGRPLQLGERPWRSRADRVAAGPRHQIAVERHHPRIDHALAKGARGGEQGGQRFVLAQDRYRIALGMLERGPNLLEGLVDQHVARVAQALDHHAHRVVGLGGADRQYREYQQGNEDGGDLGAQAHSRGSLD